MPEFNALIIAGGRATRLGGIDKTSLMFNGRSLLKCALDAVRSAHLVTVVGVGIDLERTEGRRQVHEDPPLGGPAAAVAAGVRNLTHSPIGYTVVIAADMPRVAGAVSLLLEAIDAAGDEGGDGFDGVIAVDSTGRRQHLLTAFRTTSLRRAVAAVATNAAMRDITGAMRLVEVTVPDELCADVDTPADAARNGIELRAPALAG